MNQSSTSCKHNYILDVPHYFSKEDDSIYFHYTEAMTLERPEVFVHLKCEYNCGDEQHTYMDVEELQQVLDGRPIIQSKLKLI